MLNFRKLKQDYSPNVVKEGKSLYDKGMVVSSKIVSLSPRSIRLKCKVMGGFDKAHQCELEIDRTQSTTIDSGCDCSYKYDCQHLSAVLFYLEEKLDEILLEYAKETDLDKSTGLDDKGKETLRETFKVAATKESVRQGKKHQKELLQEYLGSAKVLGQSPYFLPEEALAHDQAELEVLVTPQAFADSPHSIEIQLALRLPFRSKPLYIPQIKDFLDAVRYGEPFYIGNKRYFFSLNSFDPASSQLLKLILDFARFSDHRDERCQRVANIDVEAFGVILAQAHTWALSRSPKIVTMELGENDLPIMPCLYIGSLDDPMRFSPNPAGMRVELEYLQAPAPKLLLKPTLVFDGNVVTPESVRFFECAKPGLLHRNTYYSFPEHIKRKHLRNFNVLRDITIPEPLFGTFVENSLPELMRFAEVPNREVIERFVTLPFVGNLTAECDINYLDGELEATLHFIYDKIKVPAAASQLTVDHIEPFVTKQGILARNLTEEQKIIEALFQDFAYDPAQGVHVTKVEKKIVEFMTEVIPLNQHRVKFNCPENLLDQFIYDNTKFTIDLKETSRIDLYEVSLKIDGHLNGVTVDQLWECLASRRAFIELVRKKVSKRRNAEDGGMKATKILVLDLEKLAPIVHLFDELGVTELTDHKEERPLWSLASIDTAQVSKLPISFSMTNRLKEIQQQMLGKRDFKPSNLPTEVKAELRNYQTEGIHWLERLRHMHLNGILADDMGLGKTLQAIIALTQHKKKNPNSLSIVICPTSLVYNWKEELSKFNPNLKVLPVDGTPIQRKKLQNHIKDFDVVITSYSLLQKDIEFYKDIPFAYAILDEAQHIKNRGTRNAKSVKMIQAAHRLILTGTPIENSLDELWSLFDFLMPGLLSTYDRFVEKYIRSANQNREKSMENLRQKVFPFILRRMKKDVLTDLPPVSHITYHCQLSDAQRELYHSYAASAREELSQLVEKEGFDRIQIHVLATLTRLKQICCHPAIFAKEKAETGDSAKYDMLMELLQTLIAGKHRTVIFSQYTRMLNIIRNDLEHLRIPFEYLDGTSKNRVGVVKKFNEDENIPVFLVSLKAGGSGLNLVGADTVIHYDMWWNPAVENQATDRVHRIGQKQSVSAYKLVTLNTVEEKILELQNRKRELVQQVVTCDEDAISKLTWEEVLELLQT